MDFYIPEKAFYWLPLVKILMFIKWSKIDLELSVWCNSVSMCMNTHSNTPVVFFLSIIGAGLVLQSKAGIIWAIVAGSGGAGTTGASGQWAGAWKPRGMAHGSQLHGLVHHLHGFKHTPRVVPARRNGAWVAIKRLYQFYIIFHILGNGCVILNL